MHHGSAVPHKRGDCHRVITGIVTLRSTDVGMGVDPNDGQVLTIAMGKRRERRDAHRAIATEGRDAGRIVPANSCQCLRELVDHNRPRLDAILFLESLIGHADRNALDRAIVRRKNRFENRGPYDIAASRDIE
nr:hypothetical protein [uncultured bacterium]